MKTSGTAPLEDKSVWHRLWMTPLRDLLRGRVSGRWDFEAIVAEAGFSSLVEARILDVVKRTRLTRKEKAEIASELVAHFMDGLEAGTTEAELLTSFGDSRIAAKLMRRAKLRCRACPRKVALRMGQAFCVMTVFYLGAVLYYAGSRPEVSVNYLDHLNAPVLELSDHERAWSIYREALLELGRERLKELPAVTSIDVESSEWEKAIGFILENEAILEKIRLAASKESLGYVLSTSVAPEDQALWPGISSDKPGAEVASFGWLESPETFLGGVLVPYLMEARSLSRLLQTDALYACEQGDGERAVENIVAMLGLTRQLMERPLLIDQLVAIAGLEQAVDVTGVVLRDYPKLLNMADLRILAHAFADPHLSPGLVSLVSG
jgi:hypothetical protein